MAYDEIEGWNREALSQELIAAWMELFPKSTARASVKSSDAIYFSGYLQPSGEWANNISHNDPLNYHAWVQYDPDTKTVIFEEMHVSFAVQPKDSAYYCEFEKLRRTTIKDFDIWKAKKRFAKVKEFIMERRLRCIKPVGHLIYEG